MTINGTHLVVLNITSEVILTEDSRVWNILCCTCSLQ